MNQGLHLGCICFFDNRSLTKRPVSGIDVFVFLGCHGFLTTSMVSLWVFEILSRLKPSGQARSLDLFTYLTFGVLLVPSIVKKIRRAFEAVQHHIVDSCVVLNGFPFFDPTATHTKLTPENLP